MAIQSNVEIYDDVAGMAAAAAVQAAKAIRNAITTRGSARILVATGNSQIKTIEALMRRPDIEWAKVDVFHLDEYVGIDDDHQASFRRWIRTRFVEVAHPRSASYLNGDAPDPDAEAQRYAGLLNESEIDLAFVGFGENGHIAFNDPPVADFDDPLTVKRVTLDEACRRQQAGEGHFPSVADVPTEALTITCSALLKVAAWVCCVPEERKANAVRDALEGPISTSCPASLVRRHPNAKMYLDRKSASKLTAATN